MKKGISILLVLVMAMVLFVGCGGNQSATGGDQSAADEPVVIRFSMWDTVDETVNFIQAFHDANPDIRIELVNIPEDYSTVINTMVIGGTAPDVILAWEVDMPRFARSGAIVPLDDLVTASDKIEMNDLMPAVLSLGEMTEGLYGIPWVYVGHFLYYNKDMFDAAGISYPTDDWTWDDMATAAQALTIRDGNSVSQWGLAAIDFPGIWYSMIGSAGDEIVDSDMNLVLGDGLRRALEFQNRLTNELEVSPRPDAAGAVTDLFLAERAAMTRHGNWFLPAYKDAPFNWDIAPLPKDQGTFTNLHTGFFTINSKSPNQAEAWRFIEFMMSYEGQTLLSEFSANPSAIMSIAAEGAYKVQGENGPANWGAFDYFNRHGRFTYVLLNSTVTGDLVSQFDAVLLGVTTIDDVINTEVPRAVETLKDLG